MGKSRWGISLSHVHSRVKLRGSISRNEYGLKLGVNTYSVHLRGIKGHGRLRKHTRLTKRFRLCLAYIIDYSSFEGFFELPKLVHPDDHMDNTKAVMAAAFSSSAMTLSYSSPTEMERVISSATSTRQTRTCVAVEVRNVSSFNSFQDGSADPLTFFSRHLIRRVAGATISMSGPRVISVHK